MVKTKVSNLTFYEKGELEIDFFAEKNVSEDEKENLELGHLFSSIYKLNTLAFIGVNASGKTVGLSIINDILCIFVNNRSLSEIKNLGVFFEDNLEIDSLLTDGKFLYRIKSIIKKDKSGFLYFEEESLQKVRVPSNLSKKGLMGVFDGVKAKRRSEYNNPLLKRENSIFSAILNEFDENPTLVINLARLTNFNFPVYFTKRIPSSFVNYLDFSIEKLSLIETEKELTSRKRKEYLLKFKESEEEIILNDFELEAYLSSGTIKGINFLLNAFIALDNGGYLIVDEIENHLNKSIVRNLISLFTCDLNKKGATLIFTTHYSEILDSIDRSDSIYVTEKNKRIFVEKFSRRAGKKDRIDKKKSDLVLSGQVGSAPSYSSYMALKRDLRRNLFAESEDI